MVPFPGTELWDNAPKYEIELTKDWEKYVKLSFMGNPQRLSATFNTKYLRAEDLTRAYHAIFERKRPQACPTEDRAAVRPETRN
jgi:hypothetical protein